MAQCNGQTSFGDYIVVCQLDKGHAGKHENSGERMAWPNLNEPPSPAYLRTLRDRAAVEVMAKLVGTPDFRDASNAARYSVHYASALVAALYPGEVRDE